MKRLTWQEAHEVSIVCYLSQQGIFPVYSSCRGQEYHYHSPIRQDDDTPSFHVNVVKNKWHDKGLGIGGDSIDLVAEHQNLTRSQACHWLSDSGLYQGNYVPEHPTIQHHRYWSDKNRKKSNRLTYDFPHKDGHPKSSRPFAELEGTTRFRIEAIQHLQHPVLLQYLTYRKINPEIAKKYGLQEISYYLVDVPDSEYFALTWRNASDGYELNHRSDKKSFKACLGYKDITVINLQPNNKLAVFEGMLDFLAYLTHYQIHDFQSSAVILNSLSLKQKLLEIIKQYTPSQVYLFLDNDREGKKATAELLEQLTVPAQDRSNLYAGYKDFNEFLIQTSKNAL